MRNDGFMKGPGTWLCGNRSRVSSSTLVRADSLHVLVGLLIPWLIRTRWYLWSALHGMLMRSKGSALNRSQEIQLIRTVALASRSESIVDRCRYD